LDRFHFSQSLFFSFVNYEFDPMSVIVSISTAVPEYKHSQSDLAGFMADLYQYSPEERRRLKALYMSSGIETRYSVIPDFSVNKEEREFFPATNDMEPFPDIAFRMNYFNDKAGNLCIKAIDSCIRDKVVRSSITHLITVSCTGLSAPGLDIELVQALELNPTINRTSINFMGCYAAIHGLKQADYISRSDPQAVVLVVCVELCSLHFQKSTCSDNLIANLLFADGAAAALIVSDEYAARHHFQGFRILKSYSCLNLTGKADMAWNLSPTGFIMTLSAYVPQLIENGIGDLLENALKELALTRENISHWAIHPGGKKILQAVQNELGLNRSDLNCSYEVLKQYGNMSSPTFLFVLDALWKNKVNNNRPELTFGLAFGPGLTLESLTLENA
jgi:predicted naringenin-chalcone synthase